MRLYEHYYMDGPTKVTVEFFILQPSDVANHVVPDGHIIELSGLNRFMDVLKEWFVGTSLEGINPNTLKNKTPQELRELTGQLLSSQSAVDVELGAKLDRMTYQYESFLKGPQE